MSGIIEDHGDISEKEEETDLDFRIKVSKSLKHPDLNVLYRVKNLELSNKIADNNFTFYGRRIMQLENEIEYLKYEIEKLKEQDQIIITNLTEARAAALKDFFDFMKPRNKQGDKYVNMSELADVLRRGIKPELRLGKVNNPRKAAYDVTIAFLRMYPKNGKKFKKYGKNRSILKYSID